MATALERSTALTNGVPHSASLRPNGPPSGPELILALPATIDLPDAASVPPPLVPEAQAIISGTVNTCAIVLSAISGIVVRKGALFAAFSTFNTARHKLAVPVELLQKAAEFIVTSDLPTEHWVSMVSYSAQIAELSGGSVTAPLPTNMQQSLALVDQANLHGTRARGEVDELGASTSLLASTGVRAMTKWLGERIAKLIVEAPKEVDAYRHFIGIATVLNAALGARFSPLAGRTGQLDLSAFGTWMTSIRNIMMGAIVEGIEQLRVHYDQPKYHAFRVSTLCHRTVSDRINGQIKLLLPDAVAEYKWRMEELAAHAELIHLLVDAVEQRSKFPEIAARCEQRLPKIPVRDWKPDPLQLKGTVTLVVLNEDGTGLLHQRGSVELHSSTAFVDPRDYSLTGGEFDVAPGQENSPVVSVARMSGFGVSKDGTVISPMGLDIFSPSPVLE